jgi:hypothetical protein
MNVLLREPTISGQQTCVSPASYWLPDLMADSAWIEHAPFGFWIASALKPRMVVELGVHRGFSYFVLCQAVAQLRLPAKCFAIDNWTGDEHAGFYGDDVYEAVCAHNRRYEGFSRLIRSDFADANTQFADRSIDLLHIDGYHTYEATRRDFESWLPKMSKRGVVMFHDTAEYGNGFGVYRLWEELRRHYRHFEFMHGHGLGVVCVGDDPPGAVRALFEATASPAASHTIRATYERFGGYLAHMQRAVMLDQQVRALEAVVASYQASTSWRVTAPLRAAARLMNSARGVADITGDVSAALRKAAVLSGEPGYRPQPRSSTLT